MQANLKKFLVVTLALISLSSLIRFWYLSRDLDRGSDAIVALESRLAPVKDILPFQRGVIGYVGEWDVPGIEYAYWDQMAEYLLAQYTLAPLILKRGAVADWNVVVLGPKALQIWQQTNQEDFQVIPLKHNVYLFHRPGGQ